MTERFVPLADQVRAAASLAGIYREAGLTTAYTDMQNRAAELMRGTTSGAIIADCRVAWVRGFETGRRLYHNCGYGESIPADAKPLNPSPRMQRAMQHADDLDRFYATQTGKAA